MKSSSKKRKIYFVLFAILFVLSLNFFEEEVREFFYSISSSTQKTFWQWGGGISNFGKAVSESQNLKKENQELNLKNQELFYLKNSLEELTKENKTLREALNMGLQREFRLEFAEIIGKDLNKDSILIDKGSEDGISKGFFVITSQKILVGKIQNVYQNYSRVVLVSNKESSFEARVSGGNVSGLIKGAGASRVIFDLIPRDDEIKEGDLVVSEKFLIGLVKEVKKTDIEPFQKAEISSFLNLSDLDKVFITLD